MCAIRTGPALKLLKVDSSTVPIRKIKSWIFVSRHNSFRVQNERGSTVRGGAVARLMLKSATKSKWLGQSYMAIIQRARVHRSEPVHVERFTIQESANGAEQHAMNA